MYPMRLRLYMGAVGLVALGLVFQSLPELHRLPWGLGILAGCVLATSLFAIPLPRGNGTVTVSLPVLVVTAIIYGPWAVIIGVLCTCTSRELTGKVRWPSVLFNRAQYGIVGWLAWAVFHAMGGSISRLSFAEISLPLALGSLASFAANNLFVATAISLRRGTNPLESWRIYMSWSSLNYFVMLPISYLMAVIYRFGGPWPELFFLVPLAASRWIYVLLVRIRQLYGVGVRALLAGLDAKDPYTYGHSLRVGKYAELLARHMGLAEDRVEAIAEAGRLHDIGKVGTPDHILKKPARLTIDELSTMQRHPSVGGELVEVLAAVGCVKNGVIYHHERWDGSGYPFRLKGNDIPLETRIISVVDVYDAMTSNRPYRSALGNERALEEIRSVAGTQLDPAVVSAFLEMAGSTNLAATVGCEVDAGLRNARRRGAGPNPLERSKASPG